jgi:ParB-like chromosome segregation protein Spo0J
MSENIPFEKKELIIVVHNPNNLPVIDFHELKELQGDLKITTPAKIEKLKNSIRKYGIFVPKFIWIDNGTHYIEDGHQTVKALAELEKGCYVVPPIPYVEIQAKDRKDAGEKLLMIDSRFADINPEEIEIPELELDFEGLEGEQIEKEIGVENLKFGRKCPKCGYEW